MTDNIKSVIAMLQHDLDALDTEQAELDNKRTAIREAISSLQVTTAAKAASAPAPRPKTRRKRRHLVSVPADIHRMVALYHIGRKQPITTAEIAKVYSAPYKGVMRKRVYTYIQKAQLTAMNTLVKEGLVFQRSGGAYSYTLTQQGVEALRNEQVTRESAQAVLFLEERLNKVAAPATA